MNIRGQTTNFKLKLLKKHLAYILRLPQCSSPIHGKSGTKVGIQLMERMSLVLLASNKLKLKIQGSHIQSQGYIKLSKSVKKIQLLFLMYHTASGECRSLSVSWKWSLISHNAYTFSSCIDCQYISRNNSGFWSKLP